MFELLQLDETLAGTDAHAYTACASGHAGELLQGAVVRSGKLERVLVSIPAKQLVAHAVFAAQDSAKLQVEPTWKKKGLLAFSLASRCIAGTVPGGRLQIYSNIPIARGLGSSTADCVAAIRTAATYWQHELSAEEVAHLAHEAECYSDSTMFDDTLVLFEHCHGKMLERLPGSMPRMRMLVIEDAASSTPIETDTIKRPQYSKAELDYFAEAVQTLKQALLQGNPHAVADVAWMSAQINQRYFPKPRLDRAQEIALATGGYGVAVAHSGDAIILLYPEEISAELQKDALAQLQAGGMLCWQHLTSF